MSKKKEKKPTTDEMLFSIDTASWMLAYDIERLNKKLEDHLTDVVVELNTMRNEISRLNETIYEDRRVLADFVTKFFKDTKTVIDPKLGIDGGKKAKGK
jgi:orotate phosphoribosyltransferase-like protein